MVMAYFSNSELKSFRGILSGQYLVVSIKQTTLRLVSGFSQVKYSRRCSAICLTVVLGFSFITSISIPFLSLTKNFAAFSIAPKYPLRLVPVSHYIMMYSFSFCKTVSGLYPFVSCPPELRST